MVASAASSAPKMRRLLSVMGCFVGSLNLGNNSREEGIPGVFLRAVLPLGLVVGTIKAFGAGPDHSA